MLWDEYFGKDGVNPPGLGKGYALALAPSGVWPCPQTAPPPPALLSCSCFLSQRPEWVGA